MKKLFLCFLSFFILETLIISAVYQNQAECAFEQGPCGDPSPRSDGLENTSRLPLELLIKQGAMYFFESVSQFNLYLKEFEIDNFSPLPEIAVRATDLIRNSNRIYEELNQECFKYNYNPKFIKTLKNFDYDEYCEEFELIRPIYRRLKRFLGSGDVRGAMQETLKMNIEIAADLESLQFLKGIPDKHIIWRINQKFMKSKLFGQYMAEVFNKIINSRE